MREPELILVHKLHNSVPVTVLGYPLSQFEQRIFASVDSLISLQIKTHTLPAISFV